MKEYRWSYHCFAQKPLSIYKISPNVCISHCASWPVCPVVSPASCEASTPYTAFFLMHQTVFDVCPSVLLPPQVCAPWPIDNSRILFAFPKAIVCVPAQAFKTFSAHLSWWCLHSVSVDMPLFLTSQSGVYCHVTSVLALASMILKSL